MPGIAGMKPRLCLPGGIDPFRNGIDSVNTFENVAREWFEKQVVPIRAKNHIRTAISRLSSPISAQRRFPTSRIFFGRIEERGTFETDHRRLQICGQIPRYGPFRRVTRGIDAAERALPSDDYGAGTNRSASARDRLNEGEIVKAALKMAALTFVRPGELRHAEWNEIDLDASEWRIPLEKMKMRKLHIVSLSRQTVGVLREIRQLAGSSRYVFPTVRSFDHPSDGTVLAALRRMGYS